MLDRLVAFVAAIGIATAPVLLALLLVKQRERREDRIYASLAHLSLAEEWRGRLTATVRSSLLTGHCDVIVGACLPSTRELAGLIDRVRRAVPQAVRVTVDLVTPQDGRLVVAFVGSKEVSSPARPKDASRSARSAPM
jgi:hypothetical protein